ncbi:MAG TPA: hypothetical protein VIV06_09015, partial [Candidatus Limnocylindrales bacterium]
MSSRTSHPREWGSPVAPAITGAPRAWPTQTPGRGPRGRPESGQGLVEYGLILSGIAVVAIVTLVFF